MEVDSHDWEEFESFPVDKFHNAKLNENNYIPHQLTDSLPKNSACVLLGVSNKDNNDPSKFDGAVSDLNEGLKNTDAKKIIYSCFSTEQDEQSKMSSAFSRVLKKGFAMIENDKVWKKVVGNFGTLLPIDSRISRAKKLQEKGLNLSENKNTINLKMSDDEETHRPPLQNATSSHRESSGGGDDDEEEVQQAFDMHSLILSNNVQQEPLFTAEQVISEIEEMMMEDSICQPNDEVTEDQETFNLPKINQRNNEEIHYETIPLKKPIVGDLTEMTVLELCELYDEMECIVREYSECLIQELARRDELEFDKELKNQFISLFLSLQRKKRAYLGQEKKNKTRSRNQQHIAHASKVYLTTTIPYDNSSGPPTSELLSTYVKILKAMDDESPNLPMLLTEYILKVVCPTRR